jgi:hypothetical protein
VIEELEINYIPVSKHRRLSDLFAPGAFRDVPEYSILLLWHSALEQTVWRTKARQVGLIFILLGLVNSR